MGYYEKLIMKGVIYMKDDKIVKVAAAGFVGLVVVPIVWNTTASLVGFAAAGVGNFINKKKYDREIKKGLKDGSIVEIDGEYYNIIVEEA